MEEEDSADEIEDYIDDLLDEDDSEVSADLEESQDDEEDTVQEDLTKTDENVESDSAVDEEESEEETVEEVAEQQDETSVVMAFENLALAIAGTGMTAGEVFGEMDTSEDNLIDAPELQKESKRSLERKCLLKK